MLTKFSPLKHLQIRPPTTDPRHHLFWGAASDSRSQYAASSATREAMAWPSTALDSPHRLRVSLAAWVTKKKLAIGALVSVPPYRIVVRFANAQHTLHSLITPLTLCLSPQRVARVKICGATCSAIATSTFLSLRPTMSPLLTTSGVAAFQPAHPLSPYHPILSNQVTVHKKTQIYMVRLG